MRKAKDLTGQRFGRLTVLKCVGSHKTSGAKLWECICDCGNKTIVSASSLTNEHNNTRSCGCLKYEVPTIHGLSRSRIYAIWKSFRYRCDNPHNPGYYLYGGRGITYCKEWKDFMTFYSWAMKNGYDQNLTLDRIDVNGNYCPENCRWATPVEQSNNRRDNHNIKINGAVKTLTEWAREYDVNPTTFYNRIKRGIPMPEALTMPVTERQRDVNGRFI